MHPLPSSGGLTLNVACRCMQGRASAPTPEANGVTVNPCPLQMARGKPHKTVQKTVDGALPS